MDIIQWITGHWVEVGAIGLLVVRLLESVEELIPDEKDKGLRSLIAVMRNFFTFGWGKKKD